MSWIELDRLIKPNPIQCNKIFHFFYLFDFQFFGFFLFFKYVQCWIYEHFPIVASCVADEDYDKRKPRACWWKSGKTLPVSTYRKQLDRLTFDVVCWILYGDHHSFREFRLISLFFELIRWGPFIVIHRPERVVRQFGYLHNIPPHPAAPSLSIEEINDRWIQFSEYLTPVGQICVALE